MSRSRFSPSLLRLVAALALAAALLFSPSRGQAERPMTGRTHAVLVGIAEYPSSPLARTDVDAERIARALARNVPAERLRTHLLLNAQATRANVMAALQTVQREATEGDNVVFFFSGHGMPVADRSSDEGDQLDEVLSLYDGDLTDDELASALDQTKSRLTLVGIDACFSGGFLFDVGDRAGRMTLLSSDEDLTSAVPATEAGGHLSLLLAQALEGRADGVAQGVRGQARDGMLTALEIEVFIRRQAAQLPNISASDPAGRDVGFQFIDIKRTGVRPDLVVMQVGEGNGEFVAPTPAPRVGSEIARFPGQRLSPSGNVHVAQLTAGARYRVETFDLGGAADTVLQVMHAGQMLGENDDAAPGDLSSRVEFTAPATGSYTLNVRPYAESTLGEYTLRVAQLDGTSTAPITTPITTTAAFARDGLQLAPSGEQFTVQLPAGRHVVATSQLSGHADTMVRVLRDGQVVAENDDVAPNDLSSRVSFEASAGTYVIEVRPYAPQTLGSYSLRVMAEGSAGQVAPTPVAPVAPVAPGAPLLSMPNQALGQSETTHEIQLEAGRTYVFETRVHGAADTVITLRQGAQVLAENDDVAPDQLGSRIEFTAPAAGSYTLVIRPYAPMTLGTYDLNVTTR